MTTKTKPTVRARLGDKGRLVRVNKNDKTGAPIEARVDRKRLDSHGAFAPDEDVPVLTRREIKGFKPVLQDVEIAELRARLKLSQGAFADVFGIPLATLKDWEQGRRKPDAPARAYLEVISRDPVAVRKALAKTG